MILVAIGSGTFMSALDSSIVNTVLPVIRQSLGAQVATIEWVVAVYLLVVSCLLLSFGRLGDIRGHRSVYLFGFGCFIAASGLCGLARTPWQLIPARGLQGIGAAMLFSNAPAILTRSFPSESRGRVLGLQAMMTYLGLTVGPVLGGLLAHLVGWRSVFYINVPFGLLALALGRRYIPADAPEARSDSFDVTGAALFALSLASALIALNRAHDWGWMSPATLGTFALSLLVLGVFVYAESRVKSPMLDLGLFGSRLFSAAAASGLLNYACAFVVTFAIPFYLIGAWGLSAAQAGVVLSMQPLVMALVAPMAGAASDRIGTRLPAAAGMATMAAATFGLSRLGLAAPLWQVMAGLGVMGLGAGLFTSPNNSALMGSAPRHRQGVAAGILATARNAGMAMGIGIGGAIFTTVLARLGSTGPDATASAASAALRAASVVALAAVVTSLVRGSGETR